ncbi:RPM1-interacting protein 4 [Platanthera zijinensis]|uniref:RPM1-interacting protein 4 n=1 Tax=Platanthera zijinensis TaxID=2320716 RepID=A0AAP0GGE9_9ASPA
MDAASPPPLLEFPKFQHMHRKTLKFCFTQDTGGSLPKFGDWDPNDPTSAENFTARFNKAKDEKKTGHIDDQGSNSPANELSGKHVTSLSTSKSGSVSHFT